MKFINMGIFLSTTLFSQPIQEPFSYLKKIDPSIRQEIYYASEENFTGRRDPQYKASECILLTPVALALKKIQQTELIPKGLSFKVFDCYRPKGTVQRFVNWVHDKSNDVGAKKYFPRTDKTKLISGGYIGYPSTHSQGISVDLTLMRIDGKKTARSEKSASCGKSANPQIENTELDMGTGFDCFDAIANIHSKEISKEARDNRSFLISLMKKYGFKPYVGEWWHFQYIQIPANLKFFDFDIVPLSEK